MKKFLFVVSLLALISVFPSAALAADAVPDSLLLSLWPEYSNNQVFFMQQVKLSDDTPLPAEVRFAFPKGVQIQWTGEVFGGDISKDIQATPTVTHKDEYDEVTITLTKSRVGQVEAVWDGLKIEGKKRTLVLDWVQRYESKQTLFEFLEPSQAADVVIAPAATGTRKSPEGLTFYEAPPKILEVGQSETYTITYTRSINTPSASDTTAGDEIAAEAAANSGNPISYWMLALLFAIVGIGGVAYVYWENSRSSRTSKKDGRKSPVSQKKGRAPAKKTPKAPNVKWPLISIIVLVVILGSFAVYSFSNVSSVPSGSNCEENITYLQKGVDEYKNAWGVYPTDLKQLLETKEGKGPFVETIDLKCPTEGAYYTVVNGKIEQSDSTQQP